jgi:hypothetical protein
MGGLGSLADELADLDGDDDEEEEEYSDGERGDGVRNAMRGGDDSDGTMGVDNVRPSSPPSADGTPSSKGSMLSPEAGSQQQQQQQQQQQRASTRSQRHRRHQSVYDGSDYGDDEDLEASEGIGPGLEAKMAAVESLARRGMEENGSATDGVVKRVIEGLRDLGGQAGVEGGATR